MIRLCGREAWNSEQCSVVMGAGGYLVGRRVWDGGRGDGAFDGGDGYAREMVNWLELGVW